MSQTDKILKHLQRRPLTSMQAFRMWKCTRLAARINELRSEGWPIESETVCKDGKRFARYRLGGGA